ncbi:hypothetical protein RHSIM_Rhsim02G0056600 [Rhododendron simsii]|uniref:Cyclin-dependent kinase inhibitor domain-containing protein n=1 Tax=Rhododendron simsii TaxID=118357 RepID=A0A834H801_RHOSS|nr:hypothetical protein RHSIM_Rhsim02G0056600 [Rhododendron simsii]
MGKYLRKAKTAADVALMEVAQSSLGVRTRARTLALQRLQKSSPAPATATTVAAGGSYLQLRSRRLEKPPIDHSKRQKQQHGPKQTPVLSPNPNSRKSRLGVGSEFVNDKGGNLGIEKLEESFQENKNGDLGGGEASCGENVLEFEGRERSTRESTPCSLIRDPESIRTPGSTTRRTCSTAASGGVQNSMPSHIPTAREMDNFFSGPEEQQQKQFMDKYNFDPVNDKPLPGRFEWANLNP